MTKKKKTKAESPRKVAADKASASSKTKKARERETIERVLSVGAAAKVKLYHSYLSRIGRGETLRPSEVKHFRQLESELEAQAGNGNGGGSRGNIIVSMDEAAAYIGSSRKTVSVNIKRGRLRQNPDGTFDRAELDKFLSRFGRKGSAEEVESIRQQQEKAELRYRMARARREEILTAQLEKTLAPWEEIEREWSERVRVVAAGLEAWSDRLPALLIGRTREDIHKLIKAEVKELRQRFSRDGRYCPECGEG